MAYTTINKSSLNFNTKLYTGNGGTQAITGVGFKPDLVWTKGRNQTESHYWTDVVRGTNSQIYSNGTNAQGTASNVITAFGADGFTLGNNSEVNGSYNYASWNWKAGTAMSGQTTGSGTYKTYSGSKNTTSGFAIVKYTGNGTSGHAIPHNLGTAPKYMVVKSLATNDLAVYQQGFTLNGGNSYNAYMYLNSTAEEAGGSVHWGGAIPGTTTFTVGTSNRTNTNGQEYIAYVWSEIQGYSKFNTYTGNGTADGPFIYTGFKPAWIMIKTLTSNAQGGWQIRDNKRTPAGNLTNNLLYANATSAEQTTDGIDILSNGFKFRNTAGDNNASGRKYAFFAFGQSIVGTNNIPATAF